VAETTKNREKHYANWSFYVRPLHLEPDLSNASFVEQQRALSGFAARVRAGHYGRGGQVQAGTASGALTAVGTTIGLGCGANPTKLQGTDKFTPRLSQVVAGWRKRDSPVEKKLPVEVDVPNRMAARGRTSGASALTRAIGDLAIIAFYFLLRVGEYTVKFRGNSAKQTEQFCEKDVRFFIKSDGDGALRQLPPSASPAERMRADGATLRLGNQKNGFKNVCIFQEANGCSYFCPARALARRVNYINDHTSDRTTFLSAYWVGEERRDVSDEDIRGEIKLAAKELLYPEQRGIEVRQVDTHSLRGGGANALHLSGYSDRQIMKMGRWKSKAFLEYIREELGSFSAGMSQSMKRVFKYVNIAGDRWSDVSDACVVSDYDSGAS
jgi:hypothetical protein